MTTHGSRSLHILRILEMTLMRVTLATMHVLIDRLILLHRAVTVAHALIILSDALRSIIHFYGASIELFTVHFLESSLWLLFWEKFYKSIAFRFATDRVDNNFGLANRVVYLLKELEQIVICDIWIEIAYIHLESLLLLSALRLTATLIHSHRRCWLRHVILIVLPHIIVVVGGLLVRHRAIVVCSGDAATVWCPVQFEIPVILARDLLAIQCRKHVSCRLVILKLDEAVADGFIGLFILN